MFHKHPERLQQSLADTSLLDVHASMHRDVTIHPVDLAGHREVEGCDNPDTSPPLLDALPSLAVSCEITWFTRLMSLLFLASVAEAAKEPISRWFTDNRHTDSIFHLTTPANLEKGCNSVPNLVANMVAYCGVSENGLALPQPMVDIGHYLKGKIQFQASAAADVDIINCLTGLLDSFTVKNKSSGGLDSKLWLLSLLIVAVAGAFLLACGAGAVVGYRCYNSKKNDRSETQLTFDTIYRSGPR